MERTCKKCGETKPIEEFWKTNGVSTYHCCYCRNQYMRNWYEKNKERLKAKQADYVTKNPEKIKKKHHEYYLRNKKNILLKQKEYAIKNETKIREYHLEYYYKNKGEINKKRLECYHKNRVFIPSKYIKRNGVYLNEYYRESRKRYRMEHKEKLRECTKKWNNEHREHRKTYYQREKEAYQKRGRLIVSQLSDSYVTSLVSLRYEMPRGQVWQNYELIELYRKALMEKRTIKQLQQSLKSLQNEASTNS